MTPTPYRSLFLASPDMRSLRSIPDVAFFEMPSLKGTLCTDMYGDLPFGLLVLREAHIRGDAGYVFTNEMVPILEQNTEFLRKGKFLRPRFEEVQHTDETPVNVTELVSLTSRCDKYFWHWMMDSLPKVVLAEETGFGGSYLIPPPTRAPWATESLSLLGISEDRIITKTNRDVYAERLYVATYFCGNNAHFNIPFMRRYRESLRSAVPYVQSCSRERIFIARREPSALRRVVNQDEVEHTLASFGFITAHFEDLSLKEQIVLAHSSSVMVGPHGSGLTHSLFMDDNSFLVELFPYRRLQANNCYETLAHIPNHHYRAIESKERLDGDIEIDTASLRILLHELLP
jgi:hypothetical protein